MIKSKKPVYLNKLAFFNAKNMNILFVCSRNQWRSPTAEHIYKNHPSFNAKSAGTEPSARIKVNAKMINWADIIFVMEKKQKQRMLEKFREEISQKRIIVYSGYLSIYGS
jgi:protein-tyrosine phosphatase